MSRISVVLMVVVAACTTAVHGGFKTVDVPDEGVAKAAEQAARAINNDSDSEFHEKLVKVVKAQRQKGDIEGEIYYKLELIMGLTTCEKKKVHTYDDAKGCDIQDKWYAYSKCEVIVYKNGMDKYYARNRRCWLEGSD